MAGIGSSGARLIRPHPGAVCLAERELTAVGLVLSFVRDHGADYLLLRGTRPVMTLLLPATAGQSVSGVTVLNRLGHAHARHRAVVWGRGRPPSAGVVFSSGDLRFRRERTSFAVELGPVWAAVAEGVYREATVDPDGPAEQWLALSQSW